MYCEECGRLTSDLSSYTVESVAFLRDLTWRARSGEVISAHRSAAVEKAAKAYWAALNRLREHRTSHKTRLDPSAEDS